MLMLPKASKLWLFQFVFHCDFDLCLQIVTSVRAQL